MHNGKLHTFLFMTLAQFKSAAALFDSIGNGQMEFSAKFVELSESSYCPLFPRRRTERGPKVGSAFLSPVVDTPYFGPCS
ncbi:hypothetical protein SCLCIDRAFT_1218155 [Scleroderma citrinum Foug A]|uniref:Uncharacterized protein n=1 Tax=Scleroderma citrinum Foug A TaxID=1036808 RepID=A0A0C3DSI8_9AGAM|nr:hypothetical protein SCLCIDRAFT_1218155 [Scleroderma citrinum Foug A]